MPRRDIIVRLEDMRKASQGILQLVNEIGSFENFQNSLAYTMAFERLFEIVGEALYHIRKENPEITISEMNKIIGLRHILAHDYYDIDHKVLWLVATEKLEVLYKEVLVLIDQENLKLFGESS